MTKIGNLLVFLGIIFATILAGAATTVQSTVDRNEMGPGDSFTVTVSVASEKEVDIQEPRVPELEGFELINTWQSNSVSQKLVNTPSGMQFESQRRKDFHFMLSPTKTGNMSVSSFEVVVDGKVYRTQPIVISVGARSQGGNGKRPKARPGMPGFDEDPFESMQSAEEEIFNQLLQQRQRLLQQQFGQPAAPPSAPSMGAREMPEAAFRSLPKNPNEAFFISVEVDKTEVFEGEQVTVNWYLFTRGAMETLDRLKFPGLKGFWKEIIEEVPGIQFTEEIVNGLPWKKALLASHALFPIRAGTAIIDEYRIKSRVRMPQQGLGGFYGAPYEFTKTSARVDIKVKPLPIEGRPSDFTGAVGEFDVQASIENQTIPVNQPVSLKVRFEGAGNAKVIDLPAIQWPAGLEQYETKSESKFFKNGRSFKQFDILMIPRQEGDLTIPALSISMFNPQTKKYYTKTTQPIQLKVVNNPNAPVGSSSRLAEGGKATAPVVVPEKLPEVVQQWMPPVQAGVLYRPAFWGFVYGLITLVLLLKAKSVFGWGHRRQSLKDLVSKRYKKVDGALAKNDYRKVGAEMTNIFYTVLGEVAGTGGATLEINRLLESVPPSLRRDHGDEILKSFEIFQTLSFAPEEMLGTMKSPEVVKGHFLHAKKVVNAVIAAVDVK